jgi:uncharacterized protein with PIN domain
MDTVKKILQRRSCPKCHGSWVDLEISEPILKYCVPGAFHSKLYKDGDLWRCPHCQKKFKEQEFE